MKNSETVSSLFKQYINQTNRKIVALMFGDGISALPDDIMSRKFRYVRLGNNGAQDLSDLADADYAIVDLHCVNQETRQAVKGFLSAIQHDPNYLIITEANSELGTELASMLEAFRPRLIVTSISVRNCA